MQNAYKSIDKSQKNSTFWVNIGYLEACLVTFGVIENNDLKIHVKKVKYLFFFERKEYLHELIIRLSKEFFTK